MNSVNILICTLQSDKHKYETYLIYIIIFLEETLKQQEIHSYLETVIFVSVFSIILLIVLPLLPIIRPIKLLCARIFSGTSLKLKKRVNIKITLCNLSRKKLESISDTHINSSAI